MTLLSDTISAARSFLESESNVDSRIILLTAYIEAFNCLFQAVEDKSISPPLKVADIEEVTFNHQRVIAIALSLLGDTSSELRQLQSRGKAILAYTDTLPKRVSMRGKKKG